MGGIDPALIRGSMKMTSTKTLQSIKVTTPQSSAPEPSPISARRLVTVQRFNGREWTDYFYTNNDATALAIVTNLKLVGAPGIQYRIVP